MRSLKLTGNGLWESSRMIIPQYKEALLAREWERQNQERAQLDDQLLEELSYELQQSMPEP